MYFGEDFICCREEYIFYIFLMEFFMYFLLSLFDVFCNFEGYVFVLIFSLDYLFNINIWKLMLFVIIY